MNLEEQLMAYKERGCVGVKEEKIQETIRRSKEAFWAAEQERMLSYHEFLWVQLKLIRKRWWIFQLLLLSVLGPLLAYAYEESYVQRSMGVMASIFIILIIPEFWKNRSCSCMEIEEASFYSLRQIYAARMVLFGIVDVLLVTAFCVTMTRAWHIEFTVLLVQFLLPMLVTACICFGTLCSRHIVNEAMAVILCVLWCAAWMAVTLNEKIYEVITMPVWMGCIGLSLIFLYITVYRTLNECGRYWEAEL